jgi:peptide deformylase
MQFTDAEKSLIYDGDETRGMRILLTTDRRDSLFLRQLSSNIDIKKNKKELQHLIERMRVTLKNSDGVGLAAPQVGISRNIFLFTRYDKPGFPVEVVINPQILSYSFNKVAFSGDGCLSIPDLWGVTERNETVQVRYYNANNELIEEKIKGHQRPQDFTSIIFQHEFDHLEGVLFTDRISGGMLYNILQISK